MGSITPQTIVLITGANQGLGLETVKNLAANQPNYTLLLGSRDISKGIAAANSITTLAPDTTVSPIQLEVTSDTSIADAVSHVSTKYGHLDVLFNNAGVCWAHQPTPRQEWSRIYDVNVTGAALVTEAFVPLLKKSPFRAWYLCPPVSAPLATPSNQTGLLQRDILLSTVLRLQGCDEYALRRDRGEICQ